MPEKIFLKVLEGRKSSPPPVWLMRQAGRYLPEYRQLRRKAAHFLDFCYNPDLATEATLQPIRRFGFDAAILFADILVIPDALGQQVAFVEGEGPRLAPLRNAGDLTKLSVARLPEILAPVLETLHRVSGALPPHTALIGFAGAPWTVATYMVEGQGSRDFTQVREWAVTEPAGFGRLMDLLTQATGDYLLLQAEHGAEALQLFDSWAGAVPEDLFADLVIAPTRRIVTRLRAAHPHIPVIGFPRGACPARLLDYAAQTGVTAIGLDTAVDTGWAARGLQPLLPVQGNLDPRLLLAGGPELETETARILSDLGQGPFVFNLGHGVDKDTPVSHVDRLLAAIRSRPEMS